MGGTIHSREIETEQFSVPSEGTMQDIRFLIGNFHPTPKPYINTIGDATALALVRSGLGVSILPGIHLIGADRSEITVRKIENCKTHRIGLITNTSKTPPITAQFIIFVRSWIERIYGGRDDVFCLD